MKKICGTEGISVGRVRPNPSIELMCPRSPVYTAHVKRRAMRGAFVLQIGDASIA